ncbi:hypothetical protein EVG20_g785 [Dentipellis fragilis]|uniref:VWFA domain-containing protein n=1 Tax=Dentipellis fragilis TaxID=205917 RepID=A0A4Y9ZEF5_9AGAM|nr:hypothetical protein EVG20_g785 [Dentipellis fragilis]
MARTTPNSATIIYSDHLPWPDHLPITNIKLEALIVDVSAEITVTHTFQRGRFTHMGPHIYICPLPTGATVCGFEMIQSDGTISTGVVKERQLAAAEHEAAVKEGKSSGLVESVIRDQFSIKLGGIPPSDWVKTKLTFVIDLLDNDSPDEIRLQLPMAIGNACYGYATPSEPYLRQRPDEPNNRIHIDIRIQTGGEILEVRSPTHSIIVAPFTTHEAEGEEPRFSTAATFVDHSFLTSDFVVVIRALGLDAPRCFFENDPEDKGVAALQMTLVPSTQSPLMPKQEYLILVDRSGSMKGDRIRMARRTLAILLHSLPATGTLFNVFSFGSWCASLWDRSREYNGESLKEAVLHMETMDARFGGTEIQNALRHSILSRSVDMPTAVIVLTDGEDSDVEPCVKLVSNEVAKASARSPLRVFTLGIGNTVSSEMVNGLAKAGNGACLIASGSEDIVKKCALLMRAAKSASLSDMSIDWGIKAIQNKPRAILPNVDLLLDPESRIRQTPSHIGAVYPGVRFVVFALVRLDKMNKLPEKVTITSRFLGGQEVQTSVPLCAVNLPGAGGNVRSIHTLATRRLIAELLDGEIHSRCHAIRQEVIRLGTEYQVVSKYTSIVAISAGEAVHDQDVPPEPLSTVQSALQRVQDALCCITGDPVPRRRRNGLRTVVDMEIGDESQSEGGYDIGPPSYEEASAPEPTPEYFDPLTSAHPNTSAPSNNGPTRLTILQRMEMHKIAESYETVGRFVEEYSVAPPAPLKMIPDGVLELVKLQAFDGSFTPSEELGNIIGKKAMKKPFFVATSDQLWVTAAAVAYLEKHMTDHPELLQEIREKVLTWVSTQTKAEKFESFVDQVRLSVK